jgi:hypothetical protein
MGAIDVRPVTQDNWNDFVRLFETKGSPHYCWCTAYRFSAATDLPHDDKKACMRKLVAKGTPIGVLGYVGAEPVGWCSIAPRETYARLERSRTMPRVTPQSTSTWTVLCFFVVKARREEGVVHAIIEGAVAYAKQQGASVIEGYPFDTAGISSTHRGHSHSFAKAGFSRDGKRWSLQL